MLCFYIGGDTRMYLDYVDRFTGRMLEAEPGFGVYDVDVAPGRNPGLPVPPGDGRWAAAPDEQPEPDGERLEPEDPAAPKGEPVPPDPAAEGAATPEGSE